MMVSIKDYESSYKNQWCPGCGNFGILEAMKEALVSLEILPEKLLIVSGIGQAAKTPHFLKCNMFHALHGRALPLATGAKLANHDLKILVNSGDGDCYGEGGNHFMHAIRRNVDLTLLAVWSHRCSLVVLFRNHLTVFQWHCPWVPDLLPAAFQVTWNI